MKVTYENDYIVFDINKGPKAITEVLNAKGQEGWMASSVVNLKPKFEYNAVVSAVSSSRK